MTELAQTSLLAFPMASQGEETIPRPVMAI